MTVNQSWIDDWGITWIFGFFMFNFNLLLFTILSWNENGHYVCKGWVRGTKTTNSRVARVTKLVTTPFVWKDGMGRSILWRRLTACLIVKSCPLIWVECSVCAHPFACNCLKSGLCITISKHSHFVAQTIYTKWNGNFRITKYRLEEIVAA